MRLLPGHREEQKQDKINFGFAYQDNDLIFCQPNGDFYSPDHVGTRVKVVLRKAGYPNFSLHSLGHSHASIILGNGMPLAVVSGRLGHANQNIVGRVFAQPAFRSEGGLEGLAYGACGSHFRKSSLQNRAKSRKI